MIVSNELSDNLFAFSPTSLYINAEEKLADVIASECSNSSFALRVCQTLLQNGEASTAITLTLNGQVAIEVGFEEHFHFVLSRQFFYKFQSSIVSLIGESFFQLVILLDHSSKQL